LYSFPKVRVLSSILPALPFMDNILACYKDGKNGTRNCRNFGVVYHLALLTLLFCYLWAEAAIVLTLNALVCIVVGMLVAVIQPLQIQALQHS
jgi:hypothetical protein